MKPRYARLPEAGGPEGLQAAGRPACADIPGGITPLLPAHRSRSWREIDPGCEHYFPPVRVLVGDTAVGLPVVDLGNRAGTRGGEPGLHPLPGGSIRQVEHELVQPAARVRCLPGTDDLQVNRAAGLPEDGPVQAMLSWKVSRTGSPMVSR